MVEMAIFNIYNVQRAVTPRLTRAMVLMFCMSSHGALHL